MEISTPTIFSVSIAEGVSGYVFFDGGVGGLLALKNFNPTVVLIFGYSPLPVAKLIRHDNARTLFILYTRAKMVSPFLVRVFCNANNIGWLVAF